MNEQRICKNCGHKLADDSVFCTNFGTKWQPSTNNVCQNCGVENEQFCAICTNRGNKRITNTPQENQFKLCPKCGAKVLEGNKFCTACGVSLELVEEEDKAIFDLQGYGVRMRVYKDYCVISGKKGMFGFLAQRAFDGDKTFYYSDLTSVQYRDASTFINGFIQLEYPGSHSGENNLNSENSFVIMKGVSNIEECKKAYEYIKTRIHECKSKKNAPVVVNTLSAADEIKKYKELLDLGIITQEEFDQKKKQLLNL